ncbi:PAS domain-containing protein [Dichomitus squalens]|uniref:PAS domain-containing protein n=1 Tax=Dichomitus squalens TaxID=114155 RepID=A0A4Q9MG52_9APHY|nr:PAS domain-containing protein [Dichomitus squalens]
MPFSRYLQSSERDGQNNDQDDDIDHHFSSAVHFQLPNLIFNAPTVPPGGGAEALPAGLYPPSSSLSWFSSSDGYHSPLFFPIPVSPHHPQHPPFSHQIPLSVPSALGLPIYSASGFDLLSLLSRVVTRPYPKIYLGPVDLSCAFVVTDTRRFDAPIVYASPSFLKLTGYEEHEVIGRNCRFLQAPAGLIQRGQERLHTSREAVAHMRKNIVADKECQVSIINYRKDGSAFINMVSVIPLRGGVYNSSDETDDIVYHVGFQVDLTEQPKSILSKLKDGTYVVNYSDKPVSPTHVSSRDWRTSSMTMRGVSKDLRALLSDSAFTASFELSTSTHASTAIALSSSPSEPISLDPYDGNKPLHMFLLDRCPDFLHVVSLKGAFLYVAPAVRHVLGYDPDELVGRSIAEFCHPADCVPLMRELKEASATPGPSLLTTGAPSAPTGPPSAANPTSPDTSLQASPQAAPRAVDLLFRMQAKGRGYVWVQCRGRLHVEPGKGRKAIILSGRLRNMSYLEWGPISRAGGLVTPVPPATSTPLVDGPDGESEDRPPEREFWGLLSSNATFLYVGAAVRDVLGWGAGEVIGKPLADFVSGSSAQEVHMAIDVEMAKVLLASGPSAGSESAGLACDVLTKDGNPISVHLVLYRSQPQQSVPAGFPTGQPVGGGGEPSTQPPIVCQIKRCEGSAPPPTSDVVHPLRESVFDETDLDRSSSWQYELQQLKFKNQRLADEVASLEAGVTKRYRKKQTSIALEPSSSLSSGVAARAPAGQRMNVAYAPHSHPSSSVPPSGPLNVRFVSSSQGVSHPAPSQSSRPHRVPAPAPVSQATHSAMLPRASQMFPPQPHPSLQQHIPQPTLPVSAQVSRGYKQQESNMYLPPPIPQSTDSSLHAWSAYHPEGADPGVIPGGLEQPPVSFNAMPMKRPWDNSFRDSGGGGV